MLPPRLFSEPIGCPNASLVAMAAGLPVVATAVGGAMDQIMDGESGLLTTPRTAGALADALLQVLKDADLRRRLGAAAQERVAECFSLDRMVSDDARLIRGVQDRKVRSREHQSYSPQSCRERQSD